ncbi:MAG: ornithine carbamoyltransferase [Leptonema sp. (in: Bacteria)]|nr:ornithine carbamoyltransferase [Leptonema sp. (in: bacteria)]
MRHLINLLSTNTDEFNAILNRGIEHSKNRFLNTTLLKNKVIALLFEKASTRTRISFSVAIRELGGSDLELQSSSLQLSRGETIEDTTQVLARYVHGVMLRTYSHRNLELMAGLDQIPIINGLSDRHHPCQALADFLTIMQTGRDLSKTKIAFIGDPNNVFNSLALGSLHCGTTVALACPDGYDVRPGIRELMRKKNRPIQVFRDPTEAVKDADVVYTDVWSSMGQEDKADQRRFDFKNYSITEELMKRAPTDAMVMHCLPAHRGEEISGGIMDQYGDMIFQQAENRLHAQKAVLEWIYGSI